MHSRKFGVDSCSLIQLWKVLSTGSLQNSRWLCTWTTVLDVTLGILQSTSWLDASFDSSTVAEQASDSTCWLKFAFPPILSSVVDERWKPKTNIEQWVGVRLRCVPAYYWVWVSNDLEKIGCCNWNKSINCWTLLNKEPIKWLLQIEFKQKQSRLYEGLLTVCTDAPPLPVPPLPSLQR